MKKINKFYLFAFLASAIGLVMQLLIAQTLSVLSGNSVAKYAITLGLYLGASGIGALMLRDKLKLIRV